jgi:hypothetical protein
MTQFTTLAQLRQMSWPTKEAAIAELKRNGFKARGADYEVRMYKEGSWQIMPLEDGDAGEVPPKQADKSAATGGKKMHPADADAQTKIASAASFSIHFRASPTKRFDETAASLDEAVGKAQAMNATHGKHGRRATIFAIPAGNGAGVPVPYDHSLPKPPGEPAKAPQDAKGKGVQGAGKTNGGNAPPASSPPPAEPQEPPGPQNDLSALPTEGGPYVFRIPIGPQFKLGEIAQNIARKIDMTVEIIDKTGKIVRTIDPRLGGQRPPRAARVAGASRPRGIGKQATAIELLKRKDGASKKELTDATGWPIAQRHINRLAKVSGSKIVSAGNDRWRIV